MRSGCGHVGMGRLQRATRWRGVDEQCEAGFWTTVREPSAPRRGDGSQICTGIVDSAQVCPHTHHQQWASGETRVHGERCESDRADAAPGFPDTTVMAYGGQATTPGSSAAAAFVRSVPGGTFENTKNLPTRMHWRNTITQPHFMPVDPTIHWANPLFVETPQEPFQPFPPGYPFALDPVPHVTHMHGLVVRSENDGTAEEWFTRSNPFVTGPTFVGEDYDMPNAQSPTQLFYHDHTMGMTRINLYSGLVGAGISSAIPKRRSMARIPRCPVGNSRSH